MSLLRQARDEDALEGVEDAVDRSMGAEAEPERTGADAAVVAAGASVLLALYEFYVEKNRTQGLFVGLWAPTILGFASYLKQKSMEERLEQSMGVGSAIRSIRRLLE